jgi:hypothetical protein
MDFAKLLLGLQCNCIIRTSSIDENFQFWCALLNPSSVPASLRYPFWSSLIFSLVTRA